MNIRAVILPLLFILFAARSMYAQNTPRDISYFVEKHALQKTNPLLIVSVFPDDCHVYKIGLGKLFDYIKQENLAKNTIILTRDVREKEMPYFIKNNLAVQPDEYTLINDDDFFRTLNPASGTSFSLFINNDHVLTTYIREAVRKLKNLRLTPNYTFSLADSTVLDESHYPVSHMAEMISCDSSEIVLADTRYRDIVRYNSKTGKFIKQITGGYPYKDLFVQNLSGGDTAKINFAMRVRGFITSFGLNEFVLSKAYMKGNLIYAVCNIMYATSTSDGQDTTLFGYPFLLVTDKDFNKPKYYYIPDNKDKFYLKATNAFAPLNDSTFIFTMEHDDKKAEVNYFYIGKYRLKADAPRLVWNSPYETSLPEYYIRNHIEYSFGPNKFLSYNGATYNYFNWFYPSFTNISTGGSIQYPDSTYLGIDESKFKNASPIPFEIITGAATSRGEIALVVKQHNQIFLSVLSRKNAGYEVVYKHEIPWRIAEHGTFAFNSGDLFILDNGSAENRLYRVRYDYR